MVGVFFLFFVFFFNDTATTEIYTLSLHDALPIFLLRQRSAYYTARFSLRQRPLFLYCPFLVSAAFLLFILTNFRCGSALNFCTYQLSLRQRPRFLYCPFLVAAAPPLFTLPITCCGSAPAFYTANFLLRQHPTFYTAWFSLRQRPSFLY